MSLADRGNEKPSDPTVLVVDAYCRLVERLHPQAYSGLWKLYENVNGYVFDCGSVQSRTRDNVDVHLGRSFLNTCICNNIATQLLLLKTLIIGRIKETQSDVPIHSSWINAGRAPRDFYSPSPFVAQRLDFLSECADYRKATTLTDGIVNVARDANIYLMSIMGNSGTISPMKRCDMSILKFLELQKTMMGMDKGESYKALYLPLLQLTLVIARLVTGSVWPRDLEHTRVGLTTEIRQLRITDNTLAAIPPGLGSDLVDYQDKDEGFLISHLGLFYLAEVAEYNNTSM